ncbi:protein S100-A1-like [Huso huso]|uniref:Protein S100-A1-like n=2 Tax=Huso huso TaxID=61971 RepID=A0ABR0YFG8_HUSHU
MSQLEGAMAAMIKVFHKYSGKEGDKYTLSNGELKDLIKNELGNFLGDPKDKGAVDGIMKQLDANKDGQVDFNEYVVLIGALTMACNEFFKDQKKWRGDPRTGLTNQRRHCGHGERPGGVAECRRCGVIHSRHCLCSMHCISLCTELYWSLSFCLSLYHSS